VHGNNSIIGFFLKLLQQRRFIVIMKAVNYFISKSYKAVNIKNGWAQIFMQHTYSRSKRSTVTLGYNTAAILAGGMKQLNHKLK
jgi:hypothetical protein